jgi:hypothetical protein
MRADKQNEGLYTCTVCFIYSMLNGNVRGASGWGGESDDVGVSTSTVWSSLVAPNHNHAATFDID